MVVDFFETFRPITEEMVPGVVEGFYMVSNHGRVWSNNINTYMSLHESQGYTNVTLRTKFGGYVGLRVHRLVAMAFLPKPNVPYSELVVNHKNGIRNCNYPDNLEWCTSKENTAHAIRTGLMNTIGDNHPMATISNDTVRAICELLQQGVRYWDIIDKLNLPKTRAQYSLLKHIKSRTTWTCISKDYNFDNYPKHEAFTIEEIHKICECFEKYGRDIKARDVMYYLGKGEYYDSLDYRNNIKKSISRAICYIRNKEFHKDICSQYNY